MAQQVSARDRIEVKEPRKFKVLIHNDDITPMDFVVDVLISVFRYDTEQAIDLMLKVHNGTAAVVGTYSRDMAMTRALVAQKMARDEGYPLRVTAEPE